jgi:hypothetical protein
MKNLLLSFLLVFLCSSVFSQPEFAPIGAEWYYSQYESYNPPQANYIKHTCIKDSTINGKTVKVIQKTRFTREGTTDLGNEYLYQHGDTISYWKSGEFHELYNFSLSKGDSMLLYSELFNYCEDKTPYGWVVIDSVYSVTVNGQNLKAYFASHKEGSVWGFDDGFPIFEKIGSIRYLLPQSTSCIMDIPGIGSLRCYSEPELGSFYYENLPCDTLTTFPDYTIGIPNGHMFRLYPNPVTDYLNIEFIDQPGSWCYLEIYNNNGEKLLKKEFYSVDRVDMSKFPNGIYFLNIKNNNKIYYNGIICKI